MCLQAPGTPVDGVEAQGSGSGMSEVHVCEQVRSAGSFGVRHPSVSRSDSSAAQACIFRINELFNWQLFLAR